MCGTDPRFRPRSYRPAVGPVVRGPADGPRLGGLRGGGDGRRGSPGKQRGRAREGHHGGGAIGRREHPVAENHRGAPGGSMPTTISGPRISDSETRKEIVR